MSQRHRTGPCGSCGTYSTPLWRSDPHNENITLCNACGIRLKRRANTKSGKKRHIALSEPCWSTNKKHSGEAFSLQISISPEVDQIYQSAEPIQLEYGANFLTSLWNANSMSVIS